MVMELARTESSVYLRQTPSVYKVIKEILQQYSTDKIKEWILQKYNSYQIYKGLSLWFRMILTIEINYSAAFCMLDIRTQVHVYSFGNNHVHTRWSYQKRIVDNDLVFSVSFHGLLCIPTSISDINTATEFFLFQTAILSVLAACPISKVLF